MVDIHPEKIHIKEYIHGGYIWYMDIYILKKYLIREYVVHGDIHSEKKYQ